MAVVEGVVTGTGVVPRFGRSLLSVDALAQMAERLRGNAIPMHLEHDLDQPIRVSVLSARVDEVEDGEHVLRVRYEIPDEDLERVGGRMGLSVTFTQTLIKPSEQSDVGIFVDAGEFTQAELLVAVERLAAGGFTPAGGVLYQLAEVSTAALLLQVGQQTIDAMPAALLAAVLIEALRVFVHRGRPTRFRFQIESRDDVVTAEIETSSERMLREAVHGLRELRGKRGTYIRDSHGRGWRQAGRGRRRRRSGRG
ncbi:MAG: hypothetical protein ACLQHS_18200 [Candidatus Limnocylindrales bacterium]